MKAKFTKGKWLIGVNNTIVDDSAAENEIATIEIWDQYPWVSNANAHLIAAAPDMYAMLSELSGSFGQQDDSYCVAKSIEIDALLSKARGE